MPAPVIMPSLEMAQTTGRVVRWLKAAGDSVSKGEPILEIETDKITVEVEAPASGILSEVTAAEGEVVPVGTTIALVVGPGELRAAPPPPSLGAASPKARRLAAERGVELAAVSGSGPGGAVLAADVLGALPRAAPRAEPAAPAAPAVPGVNAVWRVMAERMTASWSSAPHFYLVREVVASRLRSWLELARRKPGAGHVTYTDLLLKLVATSLARHPAMNVSWKDGALVAHAEVNLGLAVALDGGLVVPVLHRADTLSVAELAVRREDLVARAQSGKLRPADLQGGGFTISNLGMFGVDAFSGILNPPQAGLLAVGRIAERVVAVAGRPEVLPTLILTLSCDHRAIDGSRGAGFLGTLAELAEEPLALID